MLFSVIGLLCCWLAQLATGQFVGQSGCPLSGKTPNVQTGFNYVVDSFTIDMEGNTLVLAYGLDVCTPTSLLSSSPYFKYTCGNSNGVQTVTKTKYSDNSCTQSPSEVATFIEGSTMDGEIGYFECGNNDGYASLYFSDKSDCSSGNVQLVYVGLGGCGDNTFFSLEFACSSTQTQLQMYLDLVSSSGSTGSAYSSSSNPGGGGSSTVCDPGLFCDQFTLNSTCIPIAGEIMYPLYGKMDSCFTGTSSTGTTTTTAAKNKGSVSLFTFNWFLLALVVTWFRF